MHGLWQLQKVAAGLSKVLLLPLKALGYCSLDKADRQTDGLAMTCLRAFSVTFPDHGVSCLSDLGLGGAVEDGVLVHSPQVLHDVIWTHGPTHLDRETEVSGPEEASLNPPTATACHVVTLTFQPVALKLLPALPMVRVRSHMPGRLATRGQEEQMLNGQGGGKGPRDKGSLLTEDLSAKLLTGPIPFPVPVSLGKQMLLHSSELREGKTLPTVTPVHSSTAPGPDPQASAAPSLGSSPLLRCLGDAAAGLAHQC